MILKIVPELNSNYNDKTGQYSQLNTVDISVAVATENGLITPIVKDADKIEVLDISERVKVRFPFSAACHKSLSNGLRIRALN